MTDTGVLREAARGTVAGTFSLTDSIVWNIGDVPVEYAEYLQDGTDRMVARPFFNDPNAKELKPVFRRVDQLFKEELRRAMRKQAAGA